MGGSCSTSRKRAFIELLLPQLFAMGSAASSLKAFAAKATEPELASALAQLDAKELATLKAALSVRVVVVGWGPVGHQVVSKLLAKGAKSLQITVISEESYPAYNRVKLSSFFEHRDPNKLALSSPEWCRENQVELIFGRATKIDRAAKSVEVECKGEVKQVSYEELVIATGSKPWLPPVPGLSLEAQEKRIWPLA